jgi:hypothetical protein
MKLRLQIAIQDSVKAVSDIMYSSFTMSAGAGSSEPVTNVTSVCFGATVHETDEV